MHAILNFYKFIQISDVEALQLDQHRLGLKLGLKGTIQLAPEGINAALSAPKDVLAQYLREVESDHRIGGDLRVAWSIGEIQPFRRLKVKMKDYIVVFDPKYPVKPEKLQTAPYLSPKQWRELIKKDPEDLVLLDTRNYYEYDYGTFEGAEQLEIRKFRQFPEKFLERYKDQKEKTFLMFCTGGIRCEKAAVFAREQGYEKVFQLDGGILKYFKEIGKDAYQGNCFVFDYRWAVDAKLRQSDDGPHPDQLDRVHNLAY